VIVYISLVRQRLFNNFWEIKKKKENYPSVSPWGSKETAWRGEIQTAEIEGKIE